LNKKNIGELTKLKKLKEITENLLLEYQNVEKLAGQTHTL